MACDHKIWFSFTPRIVRRDVDFCFPFCGLPGLLQCVSHLLTRSQRSSGLFADTQGAQAFQVQAPILEWRISFFNSLDFTVWPQCTVWCVLGYSSPVSLSGTHQKELGLLSVNQTAWGKNVMNGCKCLPYVFHMILSRSFLKRDMKIYCPMVSVFSRLLYFCKG